MESAPPSTQKRRRFVPRSRSGCLQCRQHHQKCDESRPTCGLCRRRDRDCQYGLKIKWGGRPFSQSAFGQCLVSPQAMSGEPAAGSGQVLIIESEHLVREPRRSEGIATGRTRKHPCQPFVYGLQTAPATQNSMPHDEGHEQVLATLRSPESLLPPLDKLDDTHTDDYPGAESVPRRMHQELSLPCVLSAHPDLPPAYRSLLDYFPRVADSFSSDATVKQAFYGTFMPMATSTSHLMASMLSLAAVHRVNAGLPQNTKQLALLRVVAVEQLRPIVDATPSSQVPSETIMATILMLCYAEVVSGGSRDQSWRMHLEGAASLLARAAREPGHESLWATSSNNPNHTRAFIARCFVSLIGLANMSARPPTEQVFQVALSMASGTISGGPGGGHSQPRRIDEFLAHSMDLLPIFGEIGSRLRERESRTSTDQTRDAPQDLAATAWEEQRTARLIERIQAMMTSRFDFGTLATATSHRGKEFARVNECFHQAALLHIHQRLSCLPASAPEIQRIVRRILDLLFQVELADSPCPGVTILFPLFSAGSGAVSTRDRGQVLQLLETMASAYALAPVRQCIRVLDAIWRHRDEHGESSENVSWENFVDGDIDMILY